MNMQMCFIATVAVTVVLTCDGTVIYTIYVLVLVFPTMFTV